MNMTLQEFMEIINVLLDHFKEEEIGDVVRSRVQQLKKIDLSKYSIIPSYFETKNPLAYLMKGINRIIFFDLGHICLSIDDIPDNSPPLVFSTWNDREEAKDMIDQLKTEGWEEV